MFLEPLDQLVDLRHTATVGDPADQVGIPLAFGNRLELCGHRVLEVLGHPDHALETTVRRDKLVAEQIVLANAHHTRRLQAATGDTCQGRELHAGWRHPGVLAADHHNPVGLWDEHSDALETATGGHWIVHHRVQRYTSHCVVRGLQRVLVGALPVADRLALGFTLEDGLVGPGRIDLVAGFAVQPVVRATQSQPLRRDDAHVVGSKRLAQNARVERVHRLVDHVRHAAVPKVVRFACLFQPFGVEGRIGNDLDLRLVHDRAKVGVEPSVHDLAKVLEVEPLVSGRL